MLTPREPFEVTVYKSGRAFNFPKARREALGIRGGDSVYFEITNSLEEIVFQGRKVLKSGNEIYGEGLEKLQPGSRVHVEALHPILAEANAKVQAFEAQESAAGLPSDPRIRRVVELYAMGRVKEYLSSSGYLNIQDTHKTESYDYTCEFRGRTLYVEVKGTQGPGRTVVLTRNEVEHQKKHPTLIVIVHHIKLIRKGKSLSAGGGVLKTCRSKVELASLLPLSYQWKVSHCGA